MHCACKKCLDNCGSKNPVLVRDSQPKPGWARNMPCTYDKVQHRQLKAWSPSEACPCTQGKAQCHQIDVPHASCNAPCCPPMTTMVKFLLYVRCTILSMVDSKLINVSNFTTQRASAELTYQSQGFQLAPEVKFHNP